MLLTPVMLPACNPPAASPTPQSPIDFSGTWVLAPGTVEGRRLPNVDRGDAYGLPIATDGQAIRALQTGVDRTDALCQAGVRDTEDAYFVALPLVRAVEVIDEQGLILVGPQARLEFRPAPDGEE